MSDAERLRDGWPSTGSRLGTGSRPDTGSLSSALPALRGAGLCVLGLAATWVLANLVPVLHWRDAVALNDFTQLSHPRVDEVANTLLGLLNPLLYTLWALLLVAVAILRRRPRVALAVALVLPAAPLSAELLKPLLAHPHARVGYQWIGAASWPSGHATAAMTLVLCALLVAPRRLRPTVALLGSAFAIAVGVSLLLLAWHMPSDVLGGYLLAALFGSLALAALRVGEARRPATVSRRLGVESTLLKRRAAAPAGARPAGWGARPAGWGPRPAGWGPRPAGWGPRPSAGGPRPGAGRAPEEDLLTPAMILLAGTLALLVLALMRPGQLASFAGAHHLVLLAVAAIALLAASISSALTLALRS